ncbi:MAG: HAMP domain-containing histidine kinase [Eubacterium sp.]|nr:HAMP domain-containing histidine kinase [Eubacterium sp.]
MAVGMTTEMATDRIAVLVLGISIFCLVCAIAIIFADYCYRKRCLKRMYDMIQEAMDGTFRARNFDESLYAAVENKLAEYIDASKVAAGKTAKEKEQIETLITDISHQTKTPLANILLYAELLKEQAETEESRENIELLKNQAEKLNFLIQSLVKMSRLETGILALNPKRASVAELLEEAERQYTDKAHEKGLYLHILSQEARNVMACFDKKWTLEALGNLIDNAVKYTETGGVTVRVRPFGLFVCIVVADTGIGIPEEEHARVFGRFYRSPQVSDQPGVGIGLYLAREILQQQSGYMKLVSEERKGAVFSVYLPVDMREHNNE